MRLSTTACAVLVGLGFVTESVAGEVGLDIGETILLEAEQAPLRKVLVEVSEAAPLTLSERGEALEQAVTLKIEAETWSDLFSELLGRESFLLISDGGRPVRLVVLWDAVREVRAAEVGVGSNRDVGAEIRAPVPGVPRRPDDTADAVADMGAAREAYYLARGGPGEAKAKEEYLSSIAALAVHDGESTVEALLQDVDSEDRDVNLATLEALRGLGSMATNPKAIDAAFHAFETAPDDEVERASIELLTRYGDQKEVMRLLEPLAMTEGPNQDIAARAWVRIREEQVAQERVAREGDPQLQGLRN